MSHTRQRAISPSNPESGIQVRPFAVGFTRAVWVPAGMERRIEVSAGLAMRTLYFKPGLATSLPRDCCVVNVPPLMRELILHTIDIGMLNRAIPSHAR